MSTSFITPHILESLRNRAAYPVQTNSVELIQTHISWLFLTDTHVFKLKKPVNFGFLDFSTLELRHFYCIEEVRLNRRLCPDIYEQVIALRESDAGAAFVGEGNIIEYAVMMKRLPADRMLDRLVDSGSVTAEEIRHIARKIARFHATAATSQQIAEFGTLEQICINWQENFEQTAQFRQTTLPSRVRETIHSWVENVIATQRDLFAERVNTDFIRDCDGDIHLGNICLVHDTAYIFDCIEFNERFRYSDTAADIAFLLMDLEFHGRSDLADAALSAYIGESGDVKCAKLMTFYKVYRAFVRGKVASLELLDSGIDRHTGRNAEQQAIRYFRLAQGYCLRERLPPTLFITCGTMGCGKSTLAGQLAFELGLVVYNSDTVRKELAGLPAETAVQVPFGEGLYAEEMSNATYRELERLAGDALVAGSSVVIDAGFGAGAQRAVFSRLAASCHVAFIILFVQCQPKEQLRRLRDRSSRGHSVSDGRFDLLEQQTSVFEAPAESDGTVISCLSNSNQEHTLELIYRRLFGK